MQVEPILKKIIQFHNFNNNEGLSCLISDKEPFPSNEGLLLWFSSRNRIETKIQLFHSPARIHRMGEMLNLSEKEYIKLFSGYIVHYLKALREIGFEPIGKGVELFGKSKIFNLKADFAWFVKTPSILRELELVTIHNPIVEFAEEQGYFECTHKNQLVGDESSEMGEGSKSRSKAKRVKSSRAPKGGLNGKLQKIAEKNLTNAVEWEAKKVLWIKQIGELYKKVQGWLVEYSGHLSFHFNKLTLVEEYVGSYQVDSLEINIGGHGIVFQPVEMNLLGTLGRLDLYRRGYKAHKVVLFLTRNEKNKLQWELWKSSAPEERDLVTKESLEKLLNNWLDY